MAVVVGVLNGTNLDTDFQFSQAAGRLFPTGGVYKNFLNELIVTTGQVDVGAAFVPVTRTSVSPNETFSVPVRVTAPTVVDTTGNGFIILQIDQAKINDGSTNPQDGTGVATIQKVAVLPPGDGFIVLASLLAGVITDARTFLQISADIAADTFFFTTTGAANTYNVASSSIKAYKEGLEIVAKLNLGNTGPSTMQINGLAVLPIVKESNVNLVSGDLKTDGIITLVLNLAQGRWEMQSPVHSSGASDQNVTADATDSTPGNLQDKIVDEAGIQIPTDQTTNPADHKAIIEYSRGGEIPLIAGINLNAGTPVCMVPILNEFTANSLIKTNLTVGDVSGHSSMAFAIRPNKNVTLSALRTTVSKIGAPIDNLILRVESDNAGSPSGTPLAISNPINGGIIGVSPGVSNSSFVFPAPPVLTAGTLYWIVLTRSGGIDVLNHFIWVSTSRRSAEYIYKDSLSQGVKMFDGVNWSNSNLTAMPFFDLINGTSLPLFGEVILKTRSNRTPRTFNFIGFVKNTVTEGQKAIVSTVNGEYSGNDLITGKRYYLSSVGSITALPPQITTFRKLVGIATSQNTIKISERKTKLMFNSIFGSTTSIRFDSFGVVDSFEATAGYLRTGFADSIGEMRTLQSSTTNGGVGFSKVFNSTLTFFNASSLVQGDWIVSVSEDRKGFTLNITKLGTPGNLFFMMTYDIL